MSRQPSPSSSSLPPRRSGGTGRSANHLLNFSFVERPAASAPPLPVARRGARRGPAFNRDRFVNANYQFIVKNDVEYSAWLHDPDAHVDWRNVEEVIVNGEVPHCPVCLGPPSAARLTKCGHILCWTCFLRCMSYSSDPRSCQCPLCYQTVYPAELRPVRCVAHKAVSQGDAIEFVLVQRPRDASIAVPRASWDPNLLTLVPRCMPDSECAPFFHLQLVTSASMLHLIAREAEELLDQFAAAAAAEETDTLPFFHIALAQLRERALVQPGMEAIADMLSDWGTVGQAIAAARAQLAELRVKHAYPVTQAHTEASNEGSAFLFYQAADARPIFIHPIYLRALANAFGGYKYLPDRLTARVTEVEECSQTQETRRRLKFLAHLPLTTVVTLVGLADDALPSALVAALPADIVQYRARMRKHERKAVPVDMPAFTRDMYEQLAELSMSGISAEPTVDPTELQSEAHFPAIAPSPSPSPSPEPAAIARGSYASMASKSTYEHDFPVGLSTKTVAEPSKESSKQPTVRASAWTAASSASGPFATSGRDEPLSPASNGDHFPPLGVSKKRAGKQVLFSTSAVRAAPRK